MDKKGEVARQAVDGDRSIVQGTLPPEAGGRRAAIMRGLRRCILEKGFAATTLKDLAEAAGMSPSHLLYYYRNKEAVLEDFYAALLRRILSEVTEHRGESAEEQCHMLADYFFVGHVIPRSDQSVLLELLALGMHNERLRRLQEEYERTITAYLEDLFRRTPRMPGLSAEDAAALAASVWMGLFIVSYFDGRIGTARARSLFRQELLRIAGLDRPSAGQAARSLARRQEPRARVRKRARLAQAILAPS